PERNSTANYAVSEQVEMQSDSARQALPLWLQRRFRLNISRTQIVVDDDETRRQSQKLHQAHYTTSKGEENQEVEVAPRRSVLWCNTAAAPLALPCGLLSLILHLLDEEYYRISIDWDGRVGGDFRSTGMSSRRSNLSCSGASVAERVRAPADLYAVLRLCRRNFASLPQVSRSAA
ncbi:unnamed protein product, partial [Amoebophrya sp. A25]